MIDGALVLEGGSLRILFTAGVLDVFTETGIEFSYVNGVSAGTMAAMNYISKQNGRMLRINEEYLNDRRYMSFRRMFKERRVFDFDFVFGELSEDLIPFDFEAFYNSPQIFEAAATRCKTGKTEFFEKQSCTEMVKAIQASSSIPLLSGMVTVAHKKYLDGGVSLPIAYERAFELGYEKRVLVLTRHKGYRKKPYDHLTRRVYHHYFKPLPEFLEALYAVPERYNRMQEEIERLEAEGKIFVIRPQIPVEVSRLERDIKKLRELHKQGRKEAEHNMESLKAYLNL